MNTQRLLPFWLSASFLLFRRIPDVDAALYNTVIQTNYGTVQGFPAFNSSPIGNISNWKDVTVWKGIPYGASTAGENRWRAPQPAASWNTTYVASTWGFRCPQKYHDNNVASSEDCLNLNIWTAANNTKSTLPVVLWSYPAGGSADQPLFDGAGMASKGLVFVNYNYRTGSFGWLAHPELSEEFFQVTGQNSSGNWGLLDQYAALKWVHANIAAFGGDSKKITVMGQSAGSAAVYHAVNSPLTKGLISGAIAESGIRSPYDPMDSTLAENYSNLTSALATGISYVAYKNVSTIAQLRQLPMASLIDPIQLGPGTRRSGTTTWKFGTTLDYYAVPDTYLNTLLSGPANDVPLITGNTKDESGASTSTNLTVEEYTAFLQATFGNSSPKVLKMYPAANATQADMSYNAYYRDTSRVSSWLFANGWHHTAKSPIYTYYWDHAPPGQNRGAYHESEITYVLNNLYGTDLPWETEDFAIAEKMSGYWVNFAKTGDPNRGDSYGSNGSLVHWNPSTSTKNVTMHIGDGWGDVPLAAPEQVEWIANYFAQQPSF